MMTSLAKSLREMDEIIRIKKVGKRANRKNMNYTIQGQVEVNELVLNCKDKKPDSYKLLYQHFYSYAMSICIRYSANIEEAKEMLNDGFSKVFTKINSYDSTNSFEDWLHEIMIDTAILTYRKNLKYDNHSQAVTTHGLFKEGSTFDKLSHYEVLKLAQQLRPTNRIVYSMYVIDGYSHDEIAEKLNIPVDTSKVYLMIARANLKKMVQQLDVSVCVSYS